MHGLLVLIAWLQSFALLGLPVSTLAAVQGMRAATGDCVAPALPSDGSSPSRESANLTATPSPAEAILPASPEANLGAAVDAVTVARIIAGIENFVACRNAGEYAAYASLLTPRRMLAEAGTTNPNDVIASLQDFNLPIAILALGNVRAYPDGRFSAEFVHLFGPHLYYRSRLYVVEEGGGVRFDEEVYLPEQPAGDQTEIGVGMTDFAFALSETTVANAPFVVLRGRNDGSYPHEMVVVRLPSGATVEEALSGDVPEESIVFAGQTAIAPGMADDLVLVNLEPGIYTILCFIAEPDGVPHAAKGMAAQVTIEGIAAPTP